ncbi:hypothetical protein EDC39_11038 [Geothermobacter ehrlichii]|uniref:histidine kinase n=1 Tax=Geothermobacter ehrlichii TaxID=213224 RepID=A0A5D3WK47_9BACT|nr:ATP-binding protein [Geothermobacter ehrlichii]TYO97498.1 hypothetical protein EDC39_11038 [Geothermobacter ehrlichii]
MNGTVGNRFLSGRKPLLLAGLSALLPVLLVLPWTGPGQWTPLFFGLSLGSCLLLIVLLLARLIALRDEKEALARQLAEEQQRGRSARDELAQAQRRQRQLLDWASDAILFIDPQSGRLVDQNREACRLLGYSTQELAEKPLLELMPETERSRYLSLVERTLAIGHAEDDNLVFRRRDNSRFTGAIHTRLGNLGRQRVIHAILRDITAQKQIEQELRQKNRDLTLLNRIAHQAAESHGLQALLDTTLRTVAQSLDADSGSIFLLRHGGNDLHLAACYNMPDSVREELSRMRPGQGLAGAVAATGHPRSSVDLQTDSRRWAKSVAETEWRGFQAVPISVRDRIVGVLCICCRDKRVFKRDEVHLLIAVGKQLGAAIEGAELLEALRWQNRLNEATNRELKESRRRLKENLRRQEEATRTLERLERMKNNFLALASHELRTPLTYILAGTEILLDRQAELPEDQLRVIDAIRQGGDRLRDIVDNLLEVARLEAQSIYLGRERIDLRLLLRSLEETVRSNLIENRLSLHLDISGDSFPIWGDSDHLHKALLRVVENAIKFTPPDGNIRIETTRMHKEEILARRTDLEPFALGFFDRPLADAYLCIIVSDSGIGIDPEELPRIFDKFYEVGDISDHHTSRTRFGGKGVGLGLTLARGMIEAHGGMIWAASEGTRQGGSRFHLLLPLGETAAETEA